ncbi:MAG: F0F1 ATP synthase subunit A [Methylobacter sp.]|jgi:F-type H+-transporting ATPase subunit a
MENEFTFTLGPVEIGTSVITTWGIMLVITVIARLSTRHLEMLPGTFQTIVEGIVAAIDEAITAVAPEHGRQILPFIGSLWLFLIIANLLSLVPGLHSPTRDLSVTSALAILVFFAVPWFGIKNQGLKNYLNHYLTPSPFFLPFHIISEFSRTLALAIRLFGNMMSLEMAAMLVLLVAGLFAPIPILMLHIIEALVQAYIFGMLALVYLAGAMQTQHLNSQE